MSIEQPIINSMLQLGGARLEAALSAFTLSAIIGGVIVSSIVTFSWFKEPRSGQFLAYIYWFFALILLALGNFIVPDLIWTTPGSGCFLVGVHYRYLPAIGAGTPPGLMILAIVSCALGNKHMRHYNFKTRFASVLLLPAFWFSGSVVGSSCVGYPMLNGFYQLLLQGYVVVSGLAHLHDITTRSTRFAPTDGSDNAKLL